MTGEMKMWIPWRRLQSTSWRSGWRGWTCSLWSWKKVLNIRKFLFIKPFFYSQCSSVFTQILPVPSYLQKGSALTVHTFLSIYFNLLGAPGGLFLWYLKRNNNFPFWTLFETTLCYYLCKKAFNVHRLPSANTTVSCKEHKFKIHLPSLISEPYFQHPFSIIVH